MKLNTTNFLFAAGAAGGVAGIASALPLIGALNCLLCGWLWLGGMGAVWLYNNREGKSLDAGQGALLGAATGFIAAVVVSILSVLFNLNSVSINDPEIAQYLDQVGLSVAVLAGFTLLCTGGFFTVFGAVGGLVGSAIFKKK